MRAHPKKKPEKSKKYLDFIRKRGCVVHGNSPVHTADAHHIKTQGSGGSDFHTIGLCRKCHQTIHMTGVGGFERETGVNPWQEAFEALLAFYEAKDAV